MVHGVTGVDRVPRKRNEFGEGSGYWSGLGSRKWGGAAHWAGGVEAEPSIDAGRMEDMSAIREKAKDLTVLVIC